MTTKRKYATWREHFEANLYPIVEIPKRIYRKLINRQEYNDQLKRIVNISSMEEYEPSATLSNFKVSDFSMETLTACGAVSKLNQVQMRCSNLRESMDLETKLANFANSVETTNDNNNPVTE